MDKQRTIRRVLVYINLIFIKKVDPVLNQPFSCLLNALKACYINGGFNFAIKFIVGISKINPISEFMTFTCFCICHSNYNFSEASTNKVIIVYKGVFIFVFLKISCYTIFLVISKNKSSTE